MKIFIVLALAIASVSAGSFLPQQQLIETRNLPMVSNIEGRITNGLNATEGQFPYQVALEFKVATGSRICGGSLVSNTYVMTACHCTQSALSVNVKLGATVLTSPKETFNVSFTDIVSHPLCVITPILVKNDIALIKIPYVTFSPYINKITLPPLSSSDDYAGRKVISSGWGLISDLATTVNSILQYGFFTVIENNECADVYNPLIITKDKICTDTTNKTSPCEGDSGGPLALVTHGEQGADDVVGDQIGITSFGSANDGCEKDVPVVFTRVSEFLPWIKSITGISY